MRWPALTLVVLAQAAWARGGTLELSAPAIVPADGVTTVKVKVRLRSAKPNPEAVLSVQAEAGTVGPVRTTAPGNFEVSFTAPRLGAGRQVALTAVLHSGNQTIRGTGSIRVEPPREELVQVARTGPLALTGPEHVTLGRVSGFEISLAAPKDATPVLLVNVGRLSAPVAGAPGRLRATYTPPEEIFPQVAIIAVTDSYGALLDWMLVQLNGEGEIEARTEPRANLRVRVGAVEFGPVLSNAKGVGQMTIVAPPGITTATTIASDRLGNVKERPLDLGVPPYVRLLGTCPPRGDRILLLAVDSAGKPLVGERFALEASAGTLSAPAMLTPGAYEAILTLPESAKVGQEVVLGARLEGDRLSSAGCRIKVRAGQATQARFEAAPQSYLAGSGPVELNVTVLDAAGRPAQSPSLSLSADFGEVSAPKPLGPGQYRAVWTVPDRFAGKKAARITVQAGAAPHLFSAETSIALLPGAMARLAITAVPAILPADGKSAAQVVVTTTDAWDNAVPAAALSIRAAGELSPLAGDGAGSHRATYTAPGDATSGRDEIVVRDEQSRVEASMPIELERRRWNVTAGVRAGYATNLAKISGPAFGLDVSLRPPALSGRLSIGVEGAYARAINTRLDARGLEPVKSDLWAVPIALRLDFRIFTEPVGFTLGGSGGVAITGREVSSPSTGSTTWRGASLALGAHLGVDKTVGPGKFILEVAYLGAQIPGPGGAEYLGMLSASGGYRFEL